MPNWSQYLTEKGESVNRYLELWRELQNYERAERAAEREFVRLKLKEK